MADEEEEKLAAARNKGGLIALLQKRPVLRRLAGSPLLCAMICTLYQRQRDAISTERLELYRNCVEMLLWERDRKHRRRQVPALADYPAFNKTQLLRLLSHLAFWMMDEGQSAVSRERVIAQFADYLPNLGLEATLAEQAFAYFSERASMWDEPVVGFVEFRHRTFQEYLAAGWAMSQDKVGALADRARNEQWRETIVLAAGRARPQQSWKFLQLILKKAEAAKKPEVQRYLLLLALSCLETCSELPDAANWQTVVAKARSVFPPHSAEEADMVAKGGVHAIDLLGYDPDYPDEIAAYCVEALAAIGGEKALAALAPYRQHEGWRVQRAHGRRLEPVRGDQLCREGADGAQTFSLSALPADMGRLRLLPNLTQLDLRSTPVSDLSPLAQLPNLTQLYLS